MPEIWTILLDKALNQLDQAKLHNSDWIFGGGTVLNLQFHHRVSNDIDIFFNNQQLLSYISPRVNDANENTIIKYHEGTVYTKLVFDEGEVDFIVAKNVTNIKPSTKMVSNRMIYFENPIEIIDLLINAIYFDNELPVIAKRIDEFNKSGLLEYELNKLQILPEGEKIRGKEYGICIECLERLQRHIDNAKKYNKNISNDLEL